MPDNKNIDRPTTLIYRYVAGKHFEHTGKSIMHNMHLFVFYLLNSFGHTVHFNKACSRFASAWHVHEGGLMGWRYE